MAELDRGERHLLDRRAAVGPVGVGVQVAAQRGPQLLAARRRAARRSRSSSARYARAPRRRTRRRSTARGLGADARAGRVSVPASARGRDLVGVGSEQDRGGGAAEGLDPVAVLAAALEQERDPAQRGDRVDRSDVARLPSVLRVRRADFLLVHTVCTAILAGQRAARRPPGRVPHRLVHGCPQPGPQAVQHRPHGRPQGYPQGWTTAPLTPPRAAP